MKVTKQYQNKKNQPHKSLKHAQIYNVRTNKTKWYKLNEFDKTKRNQQNEPNYIGMNLGRCLLTWGPITGAAKLGGALLRTPLTCQKQDQ